MVLTREQLVMDAVLIARQKSSELDLYAVTEEIEQIAWGLWDYLWEDKLETLGLYTVKDVRRVMSRVLA